MFGAEEVKATFSDEEMDVYRNSFPVWFPEDAQCVLWEKDEDLFVRVFRTNAAENLPLFAENVFVLDDEKKVRICLERQTANADGSAYITLLSERLLFHTFGGNVYYTLQISDHSGTVALFRAFSASENFADKLFEAFSSSDIGCAHAIDFYRDTRQAILREIWRRGL